MTRRESSDALIQLLRDRQQGKSGRALDRLCNEARERNVALLARRGGVVELRWARPPRPQASFGFIDDWVTVDDRVSGTSATLLVPFQPERLGWVKRETVRLFRRGIEAKFFEMVDGALLHRKYSVIYARINKAGVYGLIGLHTHPLVRETIRLLCGMKPVARALHDRTRTALRDRLCEVMLCARDMEQFWESRERLVGLMKSLGEETPEGLPRPLPGSAAAGETICDRCHGIDIRDLPECQILEEPADRPGGNDWPLGAGDFEVGFRLISDIPVSPELKGLSTLVNGVEFATPVANSAIVFYPATVDGENAAVGAGTFPLIVFGHAKRIPGTLEPVDTEHDFRQVSGILAQLARWGFGSIAPDLSWLVTNIGHRQQIALEDAGRHMLAESSRSGSPFRGKIRPSGMGAMGHSAGGLAAIFLGASGVLPIEAMGLIAPASDTEALSDIAGFAPKPVLVLHGAQDTGSLGTDDQPLSLFAAAAPKKHLVTIGGANHFGYTDEIHGALDPAAISQADQQRIAKAFLTAFFRRYLKSVTGVSDYLSGARTIEGLEAFDITVEAHI